MEWTRQVDGYCERMGPDYWAEPLNALFNLAFIVVAVVMWREARGVTNARTLSAVVMAVGIGSFLFHTHAKVWAAMLDVAPIALFVLLYLLVFNRDILGMGKGSSSVAAIGFLATASFAVSQADWLARMMGSSAAYVSVWILLVGYSTWMWVRNRRTAVHLAHAALLFAISLGFRTLDDLLCEQWPAGTHFVWHLLNAMLLGWMIRLYLSARLGKGHAAR